MSLSQPLKRAGSWEAARLILALAIPNIISNISVPLLSLADTAIAGRMPRLETIGAVALATMVANFSFWLWGFLRMATTGFTAQAYGRSDGRTICRQLCVGLAIALVGSGAIILMRPLLYKFATVLSIGAESLSPDAIAYLRVAFLGAPAALMLYVLNGWFVGIQNTIIPMISTIASNVLNIALSFTLVWYWGMGVEGIAWGTVIAQYFSVLLLLLIALLRYHSYFEHWQPRDFFALGELFSYLHIAKYLLIRTTMLGAISLYFIHAGSSYGAVALGANTLLMQFFTIFAYFMDGFAYAGEALTGRYIGAKAWDELKQMLRVLFRIGAVMAPMMSVIFLFFSDDLLYLLSDKADILSFAHGHRHWAAAIPLVSFGAFLWDGVFVGATTSKPMSQAVAISFAVFFTSYLTLDTLWGINALWLAFVLYLLVRSALSTYWGLRVIRRVAESPHSFRGE
ncbi:MAG: MATE family efflux transporter [Porphyromonadaceae bacterium]|nr:MATE family efflux transporter [Porphyromonadaceae bacterium]